MSNIACIGCAGYLGDAVTDILADRGHDLWVYDALLYEDDYKKDIPFVFGDVRDKSKLIKLLDWAEVVIYLAAIVGDGACALSPNIATQVNYESVEWLIENFDGRIIFPSSSSVYGAREELLDESSPTNPLSLYASMKLKAESLFDGKDAIVFRLGTLFGLSGVHSRLRLDLVLNTLTARAVSDKRLRVFGGEQYRPLLHVRDAAQAIADNVDSLHTGIYNLHEENIKILDLAKEVQKYIPGTELDIVKTTFEDSRNYRVSSGKAIKTFGFDPQFNVKDGILEVKELLEAGRIKNINSPRYTNQGYLATLEGSY